MLFIMEKLGNFKDKDISVDLIKNLVEKEFAYIKVDTFDTFENMTTTVLSGALALFVEGEDKGILIDVREYPVRGSQEPDLEKVTRASRDGLVETIVFNIVLIRRILIISVKV